MLFPVFFDTCVLLKSYVCDTVLSIAEDGLFRPLWSAHVLDELERNLVKRGATATQVAHRVDQMRAHFPDACVQGYEAMIAVMTNHPKDRHVAAAAIRGGAELLVTENLKDFPGQALDAYDLVAVSQDEFLLDQLDLAPGVVLASLHKQVSRYRREPRTVSDLLAILERPGSNCPGFAASCRAAQ